VPKGGAVLLRVLMCTTEFTSAGPRQDFIVELALVASRGFLRELHPRRQSELGVHVREVGLHGPR
jgi:hypothetical protein